MFSGAPKFITQRLQSINNHTWNYFFPGDTLNTRLKKIKDPKQRKKELNRLKEVIQEASFVLFVFLLNRFFREGTKAAQRAVDIFGKLEEEGFLIGSKYFSGRNENVMMGNILGDRLLEQIKDQQLVALILEATFGFQILEKYRPFIETNNG